MNQDMTARIEIFALPNQPLTLANIQENGYESLEAYVRALETESDKTLDKKFAKMALVSFCTINPKNGKKVVKLTCKNYNALPTGDVEGVYINS